MGSLYRPTLKSGKPSAIYWVKYYVNGRAIRESTGARDKDAAKSILKRKEGDAATGKVWAKACENAKVLGRILHDFRRTAVRNLERAGVPRSVAMKLTGHKTESVYRRYAIVSDADLREATQRLLGTFSGTSRSARVDGEHASVQND
jgi:integrase